MPEHIRALLVISVFSIFGFLIAKKIAPKDIPSTNINQWRKVWFVVLFCAFLPGNFWVYILSATFILLALTKTITNKTALFFILLFVIPPIASYIPGLGLVNYLLSITHMRFICLLVLLPAALSLKGKNDFRFGKVLTDKLLLSYVFILICLEFRDTSVTDGLRKSFYMFTDVILPYYVMSRGIKNINQAKETSYAFVTSAIVISLIAFFEKIKGWLLYFSLADAMGIPRNNEYILRLGDVRAVASMSHSLVLGYFLAVAFGLYLFISDTIPNKNLRKVGFIVLVMGLYASLSRGPWIGAIFIYILYVLFGKGAVKKLGGLLLAMIITLPLLAVIPGGQKYLDLIPYFGNAEQANVEYREKLATNSIIVIKRNLWFGSSTYLETPELKEMVQGQGIIDIVNSYITIALESGLVGLTIFVGIFLSVIIGIRKQLKRIKDLSNPLHSFGRSIFATTIGIMFMIYTTSSIAAVPIIYWAILGFGVSYIRLAKQENLKT